MYQCTECMELVDYVSGEALCPECETEFIKSLFDMEEVA